MEIKNIIFANIAAISFLILFIVCKKMKSGIGPYNLKVLGLTSIAIFSALLALSNDSSLQASFGIFGAIAGYLFGTNNENETNIEANGNNNQLAGRDINNSILQMLSSLQDNLTHPKKKSYHVHSIYKQIHKHISNRTIEILIKEQIEIFSTQGFSLCSITADLNGIDGVILIFEKNDGRGQFSSSKDE